MKCPSVGWDELYALRIGSSKEDKSIAVPGLAKPIKRIIALSFSISCQFGNIAPYLHRSSKQSRNPDNAFQHLGGFNRVRNTTASNFPIQHLKPRVLLNRKLTMSSLSAALAPGDRSLCGGSCVGTNQTSSIPACSAAYSAARNDRYVRVECPAHNADFHPRFLPSIISAPVRLFPHLFHRCLWPVQYS